MPKDILPPCFELELQKSELLDKRMIVLHAFFIGSGMILLLISTWLNFFLLSDLSGVFNDAFKLTIRAWVPTAIIHLICSRMILSFF